MNKEKNTYDEVINELKSQIDDIKRNEQWFLRIIDRSALGIAVAQGNPPRFVFINDGLTKISGYSKEEFLTMSDEEIVNLIHPDDKDVFFSRYSSRLNGNVEPFDYEVRVITSNKTTKWLQIISENITYNNAPAVIASFIDISEKKIAEEKLDKSKELYKQLFYNIPVSIFYYDKDLIISAFNDRFVDLLQSSKEKLTNLDMHNLKDKRILECLNAPIKNECGFYEGPYFATTSSAEIVISMKTEPIKDESGFVTAGIGIIEDITKRFEAETALLQNEALMRAVIEGSPVPLVIISEDGRHFEFANNRFLITFGYEIEEISSVEEWMHKAYPDKKYRDYVVSEWTKDITDLIENGNEPEPREFKVTCKDGSQSYINFNVTMVGKKTLVACHDITESKKAEVELLKAKKIESLGVLAGGIAHDFNNILTGVLGNLSIALLQLDENDKSYTAVAVAEKAALRARDLTRQLLTFSQGGAPVKKITSIYNLVKDTVDFVLSGSSIKGTIDRDENLWNADVDESQISQVIQNIVLNSRQALSDNGEIIINISNYNNKKNKSFEKGRFIKISIKDNGKGISEAIKQNIFDPFFTTREKGSGLGLSVTYSIIKNHGGHIEVNSEEGEGAEFVVYIPATNDSIKSDIKKDEIKMQNKGTVLVMDDDELVMTVCLNMLKFLGYEHLASYNGEEALQIFNEYKEKGQTIDVVIADLTVPGGMGGKELVRKLKIIDPEVKVIVSSGYSNDPVMANYEEYGFSGVTQKPYRIEEIDEVLQKVISL